MRTALWIIIAGTAAGWGQQATPPPIPPERTIPEAVEAVRLRLGEQRALIEENKAVVDEQRALLFAYQVQAAPAPPPAPRAPYALLTGPRTGDEERLYRSGKSALEDKEWERAAGNFQKLIDRKGSRTDAALFWKAYAQNRMGRRGEALETLKELMGSHSNSRWMDDARALEIEVKQSAGQPVSPEREADEDLKVLAVHGLIHSDPERGHPVLEKILTQPGAPRLKERALFVLAQSRAPKSRELLLKLGRGGTNPDLQAKAVEYLGHHNTPETRQLLLELQASATDPQLRRAVIRAFANVKDRERLVAAVKSEQSADLRREAIRGLGSIEAEAELWTLFQSDLPAEARIDILRVLPEKEASDKLIELARTEKDPKLRQEMILTLGRHRSQKNTDALVSLYVSENDLNLRKTVIEALRDQNNAKALVQIARTETDWRLKKLLVERLSHMRSKEASDYLLEVLSK